jgi:integrase
MQGNLMRRGENSWLFRYDLPAANGRRNRKNITLRGTRREAEAQAAKIVAGIADGVHVDSARTTVADHLKAWLNGPHGLAGKTHERYAQLVTQQVNPHLGGLPLQRLKPAHIADWHAKLLKEGGQNGAPLSARTVGHAHRVLHCGLELAVKLEIVARNVAHVIDPPKVASDEISSLRQDEIGTVLSGLKGHWLAPIAIFALSTGARRGEILGLPWESVDLDRGTATISRSLEQTRAGLAFKAPKTKSGKRVVAIPQVAVEALRAHRIRQLEIRAKAGLGKPGRDALVFSQWDGSPMPPNNLSRDWARVIKARKLPRVSFHGLRRSHVSALIFRELDPLTVSKRVGHASPTTTMRLYAHQFAQADEAAVSIIEAALKTGE